VTQVRHPHRAIDSRVLADLDAILAVLNGQVGADNFAPSGSAGGVVPPGGMLPFADDVVPDGWLLCDGAAISRAAYAALFNIIGTSYGAGDGSTTFNLPNLKGRIPVGRDAADADWDVLGETRGAKTHTLLSGESGQKNVNTGGRSAAHTHVFPGGQQSPFFLSVEGNNQFAGTGAGSGLQVGGAASTGTESADHSHNIAGSDAASAHNNLQPSLVVNYIIKY
jgi:microcystin-dependent protein